MTESSFIQNKFDKSEIKMQNTTDGEGKTIAEPVDVKKIPDTAPAKHYY